MYIIFCALHCFEQIDPMIHCCFKWSPCLTAIDGRNFAASMQLRLSKTFIIESKTLYWRSYNDNETRRDIYSRSYWELCTLPFALNVLTYFNVCTYIHISRPLQVFRSSDILQQTLEQFGSPTLTLNPLSYQLNWTLITSQISLYYSCYTFNYNLSKDNLR